MKKPRKTPGRSILALICMALALVFTAASVASRVDAVEHAFGQNTAHEHMLLSDIVTDDHGDHHDTHHARGSALDTAVGDNANFDHQIGSGHHHHHGDSPTGLLTAAGSSQTLLHAVSLRLAIQSDAPSRKVGSPGPDRPPRQLDIGV